MHVQKEEGEQKEKGGRGRAASRLAQDRIENALSHDHGTTMVKKSLCAEKNITTATARPAASAINTVEAIVK